MSLLDRFYSFLTDGMIFIRGLLDHGIGFSRSMQVYYGPAPMYGVLPDPDPAPLSWFEELWQSNFKYVIIFAPIVFILVMVSVIAIGIVSLTKQKSVKDEKTSPKK